MRILLVKLKHLGDTLLLTPTLRFLRESFPGSKLDVMVRSSCEEILRNNPDVDRVWGVARPEVEKRTWSSGLRENLTLLKSILSSRYDYAFDLSNSDRAKLWVALSRARRRGIRVDAGRFSWKHFLFNSIDESPLSSPHQVVRDFETVTRILGVQGTPGPLRFYPEVDEAGLYERFPWLCDGGSYAVIHACSRWSFKEWPVDRWVEVARQMVQSGMRVVFSGGKDLRERETVDAIRSKVGSGTFSIAGVCSLHEFGFILGKARVFVGIDTFAMHMASAMQTPSVALFGPSQLTAWEPWLNRSIAIQKACSCKPPVYRTCANPHVRCMSEISSAQVLESLNRILAV